MVTAARLYNNGNFYVQNTSNLDEVTLSSFRVTPTATYATEFDEVYSKTIRNIAVYTEQFDNGYWSPQAGITITPDSVISPNGTMTADTLTGNGVNIGYFSPNAITITSGQTHTFSCHFKAGTQASVLILLYGVYFNSGGSNLAKTFNLSTGVITQPGGAVTPSGFGIAAVGNGWWRCWVSQTATSSTTNPGQTTRLGGTTGNLYSWGYQVEVGSTPTDYQGIAAAGVILDSPLGMRLANTGKIEISGTFDEVTGII
jgi:hypothetical protein